MFSSVKRMAGEALSTEAFLAGVRTGCCVAALLFPGVVFGLAPHEIAVLVNRSDASSLEVANHFIHERQIPAENVVTLSLPDDRDILTVRPGEFTDWIWKPANKVLDDRGVNKHIVAWVYSSGFPTTISTSPEMSINGITFVRDKVPTPGMIDGGYASPLFAGPDVEKGESKSPQSFDRYQLDLDDEMPLPNMMLGYTWARGNSTAVVVDVVKRGVRSDYTRPKGTIYFYFQDDIRFKCRLWQMLEVRSDLLSMGIQTKVANLMPDRPTDRIFGMMTGTQYLEMGNVSNVLPGAYADHLTSFAARYQTHLQMKASAWFDAGATLSSGTITEPYAVWQKFPHARFFVHYAQGCTAMESFYQSVRCPTQLLMLGEPLAKPYGLPFKLSCSVETVGDKKVLRAAAEGVPAGTRLFYSLLVNGQLQKTYLIDPAVALDDAWLQPGWNELRLVGVTDGRIGHAQQVVTGVQQGAVEVSLSEVGDALKIVTGGEEAPTSVRLLKNGTVVLTANGASEVEMQRNGRLLGRGPSVLRAEAKVGGQWVRSKPLVTIVQE